MPSLRDMNKANDRPSSGTYTYRFGSWNNAVAKSGLIPRNRYGEKELIDRLQSLYKELGHTPRRIDINECVYCPNIDTYERHFGSYETAITKAGMTPCKPGIQITNEELIESLREATSILNHVPTLSELVRMRRYSNPSTYIERFGTWRNALKKAGFEKSRKFISDEKLLQDLRDAAKELGHTPIYDEMAKMKKYSHPRSIANRFGSWENSIKKAGLELSRRGYSNSELLDYMMRLKNKLQHIPTSIEMMSSDGPSPITYANHFGSWKKAKKAFEEYEQLVRSRIVEDCKNNGLNYIVLREIVFKLVDSGISKESEIGLSGDGRLKHMKFVSENFEVLCDRMKLKTTKPVKLDYEKKEEIYVLKLI